MIRRLLVLGSPGAGKTRLAHELAWRTGLPLAHLDDLYWGPGWTRPSEHEWRDRLDVLCAGDDWIIDGNYAPSLDVRARRADAAVLLDVHPAVCCLRLMRRTVRIRWAGGEYRPAALRCTDPVSTDLRQLVRKAARFRREHLPVVRAALDRFNVPLVEPATLSPVEAPPQNPLPGPWCRCQQPEGVP